MNTFAKMQHWGDHHHPKWLDYLRIALGVILIWKGIACAINLPAYTRLMQDMMIGASVSVSLLAHLIIVIHLLGGLFIALGTHTRACCLLNLPVFIAAVILSGQSHDVLRPYAEFWLSVTVLAALVCFLIEGDGVLSIENDRRAAA